MTGDETNVTMNSETVEQFKLYCRHEQQINQILNSGIVTVPHWAQLRDFANKLQFGSANVTFKDSLPVRVDNPMQSIVFGITRLL